MRPRIKSFWQPSVCLVYDAIFYFSLVCLLSLILLVLYYISYYYFYSPVAFVSYCSIICAIVFKRIFWNNPTTVTVTINAYICLKVGGGQKIGPKIRTKWITRSKCCGISFCELVQTNTLKHHRQHEKCRRFLPS